MLMQKLKFIQVKFDRKKAEIFHTVNRNRQALNSWSETDLQISLHQKL